MTVRMGSTTGVGGVGAAGAAAVSVGVTCSTDPRMALGL